jgi:hypothetical protein
VCYCGGTCGDLISALIDNSDAYLHNNTVKHASLRERLKKPHQFQNLIAMLLAKLQKLRHNKSDSGINLCASPAQTT